MDGMEKRFLGNNLLFFQPYIRSYAVSEENLSQDAQTTLRWPPLPYVGPKPTQEHDRVAIPKRVISNPEETTDD